MKHGAAVLWKAYGFASICALLADVDLFLALLAVELVARSIRAFVEVARERALIEV